MERHAHHWEEGITIVCMGVSITAPIQMVFHSFHYFHYFFSVLFLWEGWPLLVATYTTVLAFLDTLKCWRKCKIINSSKKIKKSIILLISLDKYINVTIIFTCCERATKLLRKIHTVKNVIQAKNISLQKCLCSLLGTTAAGDWSIIKTQRWL